MRFFVRIAYNGTHFSGWQSQGSNVTTIQETIESALNILSGHPHPVMGCGRTDAGVHATKFYFHFDSDLDWTGKAFQLNALCGHDIAIQDIIRVNDDAHARFDATRRDYHYQLHTYKDPFLRGLSFHFKEKFDFDLCQKAAFMLLGYADFDTFCKTRTDVTNKRCQLYESSWKNHNDGRFTYHIASNRFLRGMVRLIVGMCLNVGKGALTIEEVKKAIEDKTPLSRAWSVPAHGLYLSDVRYPYIPG